MAKYLVPWSGGLDSTCLVNMLLLQGHEVEALYININDVGQDRRQLKAVKQMRDVYFNKFNFTLSIDTVPGVGLLSATAKSTLVLGQVPAHIFNIIKYIGDHDFVAIAYVMNDDAVSYLKEIEKIYKSYQGIFEKRLPQLHFPLIKHNKRMVFNALPVELREHVTWCENQFESDNCGKCKSCKRMQDIYIKQNTSHGVIDPSVQVKEIQVTVP